ncbi:MAG: hypothetical protein V4497_04905 [Bacteroidota bacterium]
MRKIFQFLFLLYSSMLLSQTVLNSYPIVINPSKGDNQKPNIDKFRTLNEILLYSTSDFNNSTESNQILNAENESTHEVFVFVKEKGKITILKYNSALFLSRDYVFPLENLENKLIEGYSFLENGNPILYLSSGGFKDISAMIYDLENKKYEMLNFTFPISSKSKHVVTTFQMNNSFNILLKDSNKPLLNVYTFKHEKAGKRVYDFSSFTFRDKNSKVIPFNLLVIQNPIEKIDINDYNPLYKVTKKSKVYINKGHMILTFDQNPKETQLFDLNFENLNINEKKITQSKIDNPKTLSNSFLYDDKLYQINASESKLSLEIKDYNSGQTIKNASVSFNEEIKFKNSPLFIQKENYKPKELKTTKKFLQHLSFLDVGLSVIKNSQNTVFTLGGTPKNNIPVNFHTNQTSLKNSISQDSIYSNQDNFAAQNHAENVFFSSLLDRNFEFVNHEQEPLAIDKLYYFLDTLKKVSLSNVLKYKDYYILSYYDEKAKQFVMRKFTDGFN